MDGTAAEGSRPGLTVIVPVRNEAAHVEGCLRSVLAAAPRCGIEVLVVDGMSDDGTAAIVARIAAEDGRVRLVSNPSRFVPAAMNLGIRAARGRYVGRVDGHCRVEPGYFEGCIERLESGPHDCVGGVLSNEGTTRTGRAIAAALSSPVAVGGAAFRIGVPREREVDTLAFGVYRRDVFERVGEFDERLVRNQDDEMNFRLVLAGGRILLLPELRVRYFVRNSYRQLARQYFQYGYWKLAVILKHGRPAAARQLAPSLFLVVLVAVAISSLWTPRALRVLVGALAVYALIVLSEGARLRVTRGAPWLRSALGVSIVHFAYGWGMIRAVLGRLNPLQSRRRLRHTDLTRG